MFDRLLKARWRIILEGTVIVAAPLLGLALFVYFVVTAELEKLSIEKRQAIALTAAHVLDEKLQGEIAFGNAYAARPYLIEGVIRGDEKEMRRHLKNFVNVSCNIERVFIASPRGILLAAYPESPTIIGGDYSYRDWFKGVSRNWAPYISEFYLTAFPPRHYVFAIAVPIRSDSGAVVGILAMLPKADFVKNTIDSISQRSGVTYLVDSRGTIIYHPSLPNLPNEKMVSIADAPAIKKLLQGVNGYEKGPDPLTGKAVISAYHPVAVSGWGVVTARPLNEVLAPVREVTKGIYLFTAIMLLIGVWFAMRRSELIFQLKKTSDDLQTMNRAHQDINEELQCQQEELSESNRQLAEVSRTKSDFLANMSHELRTPLNSVIGFSEVLQDRIFGPLNEKQLEYLKNILFSGRHLLSLINDILDLSKVESGKMELELSAFSLRDTLAASMMMLGEKALKQGVALSLEISPEADLIIEADQRKLKQIMFNLLSNAVKFTTAGGRVDVIARRDNDFIEITVTDTGIGIKAENLPKLFRPFTQLESAYTKEYEGTGLGLALTRALVELHGGRVWVKSEYGQGASFSFAIPLSQATPDDPAAIRPESITGSGKSILMIEDDPLTLGSLEKALLGRGCSVRKTANGEDGIAMALRETPGLILLDLMLPGMSGFEVVERLRSEKSTAKIIVLVLTAMDLSAAERKRLEGKVWHIAEKATLSTEELIGMVESALARRDSIIYVLQSCAEKSAENDGVRVRLDSTGLYDKYHLKGDADDRSRADSCLYP